MRLSLKWMSVAILALLPATGLAQTAESGREVPAITPVTNPTTDPAIASKVDAMLQGIEHTSTDEEWARLGDAAIAPLLARMNDASHTVVSRGRATTALSNFKTAEVSVALRAVLAASDSPTLLIRKAIQSLAKVEGAAAVDAITPHLAHRSATVREDAIKALGGLVLHPEARAALEKRRSAEPSEHLKRQIDVNLQPSVEAPQ